MEQHKKLVTSPSVVLCTRFFTWRADSGLWGSIKLAVIIGVLMFLLAFMISLILHSEIYLFQCTSEEKSSVMSSSKYDIKEPDYYLGTPCVMFMLATPAKWNVFNVICVPGSPILCAASAPTAVPGSMIDLVYLRPHVSRKVTNWLHVNRSISFTIGFIPYFLNDNSTCFATLSMKFLKMSCTIFWLGNLLVLLKLASELLAGFF